MLVDGVSIEDTKDIVKAISKIHAQNWHDPKYNGSVEVLLGNNNELMKSKSMEWVYDYFSFMLHTRIREYGKYVEEGGDIKKYAIYNEDNLKVYFNFVEKQIENAKEVRDSFREVIKELR